MNLLQDVPHLSQQFIPKKRLRESMKVLKLVLGVNPFVVEESIHDQNRQTLTPGAQITGCHVPGHAVDVGANDQQIRPHPLQAIDCPTHTAYRHHHVPGAFQCFVKYGTRKRIGIQQQNARVREW